MPNALTARSCARLLAGLLAALLAGFLAACGSSTPVRLYQLRATPADAASLPAQALLLAVSPPVLPDYLDRSTLLTRQGAGGLAALDGHRWAEPLAEATARVLRANLAARLGPARVWATPLPAGLQASHTLRLELLRFEADEGGREVVLQARIAVLAAGVAPRVQQGEWRLPMASAEPDALAAAHSAALDRLAQAVTALLLAP